MNSRKDVKHNRTDIDFNTIFKARVGGDFRVISIEPSLNGHKMVRIKFLYTGTEKIVRWTDVNNRKEYSNIRDDYFPLIAGVGCIGNASSYDKRYNLWEGMINRCYNPNCSSYIRYGALGVSVCKRWHCFEYFIKDIVNLLNYDLWDRYGGQYYNLDKDYLQQSVPISNKIYSPETCIFISTRDNMILASGKSKITGYYGVRRFGNNYQASITINGLTKSIGIYPTAELAAAAYNAAMKFYMPNSLCELNDVEDIIPGELYKFRITDSDTIKLI